MKPLLIVKTGETLPGILAARGDFESWIEPALGLPEVETRCLTVHRGASLPDPAQCCGVVVTGSPALVTDREDWSERTAAWLPSLIESRRPLLAICYGHQLLAHALGGVVARNPRGREIGTVEVEVDRSDDLLLGGPARVIRVQASHVESVLELPAGARRLAWNDADPNHAFRVGECAWGVQFHPEFDAEVVRGYIRARREALRDEGLDADALIRASSDSPDGPALLARFGQIVRQRGGGG